MNARLLPRRTALTAMFVFCGTPSMLRAAEADKKPDAWVNAMKDVHAKFKGTPGTFAQFGDSITVTMAFWAPLEWEQKNMAPDVAKSHQLVKGYMKPECWRQWKGPEFGSNGGMTIRWAMENVDKWLAKLNPETALIMFGSNDVGQLEASDYESKTRQVVQRCLAKGTVVILSTMPPRSGHVEKAQKFAEIARRLATELKVPLLDYHAAIMERRKDDWDGSLPQFKNLPGNEYEVPTLIARDGVHPSAPSKFVSDFSAEGLRSSGYTLRNYLTLLSYADIIRKVLQPGKTAAIESPPEKTPPPTLSRELAQVPAWSREDLDFFLHGSMSTEFVPEAVLQAFIRTYPDIFPKSDLSHLGLIPDPAFGWPVGFSRREVAHLGGLSSLGVNCASCHVGEIEAPGGGPAVRVLGMTSHFDAEAFFGSVILATFRTADPANMKKFLASYLAVSDPRDLQAPFESAWKAQEKGVVAAITADPSGSKGVEPGALHLPGGKELNIVQGNFAAADLSKLAHAMLKLFHNMRAALHVPDQPPDKQPPASGPGRNDAFGLLSATLFGAPQPFAPVKYGLIWNLEKRHWVHADGNTQSPLGRNLLASLGLGAPLAGKRGHLDFALVKRHTDLTEKIRPPRYPFAIDATAAKRGSAHYAARCASCHDSEDGDRRLYPPSETGTDPLRATLFTDVQAQRFNKFLTELETPGYKPSKVPGLRSTQKYWAASMAGVWARAPYLHNASVRTMLELLAPPAARAKSFQRGTRAYDAAAMGYADAGAYVLDTTIPGNAATGHDYGTDLSAEQKQDLVEFLKTL